MKWYAELGEAEPARVVSSRKRFVSPSQSDMWKWQPLPVRCVNGFGMNVASMPRCCASVWTM